MNKKNRNKIISGMMWTFAERICAQLVSTVVTIILARILDPEHYGIIAIVTVLISFLNVFVTSGFGSALVQKKDASDLDFNTGFILSIIVSVILYLALFFTAPVIAIFYDMKELILVIRVMGIRLIIASVNSIQQAYIRKSMQFRTFFWATLLGTIISGVIGIILAINGYGVWALVFQYLSNVTIDTIMLFVVGKWCPRLQFSINSAIDIWSFGWKVLATTLVFTIEGDIRSLVVGKVFGSADLAYYDQGKKYPSILVTNINTAINKVMLPAYSNEQDNRAYLLQMLRKSIRYGIYIMTPILLGFAAVSESFVRVVLTEKWIECVPFIQILSLSYLTRPLEESCHQALLAIGKSGIILKIMIIINSIALASVVFACFVLRSVISIAWFGLATAVISFGLFLVCSNNELDYSYKMQVQDLLPSISIGFIMAIFVKLLEIIDIKYNLLLLIQIAAGILIYVSLSIITKNKCFFEIIDIMKARIRNE